MHTGILYPNYFRLSRKYGTFFVIRSIYCQVVFEKGASVMRESSDPNADLDDLIFGEDDGGPSER